MIAGCGCFRRRRVNKLGGMQTVPKETTMSRATLNVCRLAAGQIALQDLHARSAVVAVEGDLQLAFEPLRRRR